MLVAITAALTMLCGTATAQAEATVRRIHEATISLVSLDRQMVGHLASTVVPDFMYLEYRSLYLELRQPGTAWRPSRRRDPTGTAVAGRPPYHSARRDGSPHQAVVTKADLRAAVKTILRGEDVNAAKPGPRLTPAKRRQIEAAEAWRKSHAGCSLHNACIRPFVPAEGGYKNAMALYRTMKRNDGDDLSS